ncbi:MAG: DEAD/DEAH box helicase [Armatimonadota bacterium]|nr:DEAD/DEAH box helicase [Armatimonadota bacterium]MDR7448733.1 DEAD/DEAH box helicase [Armatimonadota bacterium]MDR7460472.1 DEAD/DEAH box helicase [Armatimonadota bacterium]MDR7479071.1 DEAD/DEAH box helicase [Armatimonadota bacterium]MDR7488653.1 DEAD/DEAH box helicase [Armatimonadota bacterium]
MPGIPQVQVTLHPGLEPVLREVGEVPPGPFVPARFQVDALEAVRRGDVLVSAPTGSGKTWIAERAIAELLEREGTAWYTTPLKALSNQKFLRFQALFGEDRVGLLTGERRIRPRAPVVVATTEILRNALYDGALHVDLAVLDEAHYLGDPERGMAWEEIVLLAPPLTHLLLLSATMPNVDVLADWLARVRGRRPAVVSETQRPVPLRLVLMDARGHLLPQDLAGRVRGGERRPGWLLTLMRELDAASLLPAILFFPSRRECDEAVRELTGVRGPGEEARREAFTRWAQRFPYLAGHRFRTALVRGGVAPHHAGHLTAWRLVVEELLDRGLVRAVAATTTLASGLDVPARTVVLTTLARQSPEGRVDLSATEFHQMTGRAGRRGRDRVGVVVLPASTRAEALMGLALAGAEVEPVRSAFRPGYTQVLNLLRRRTLAQALDELARSLAAYEAERFGWSGGELSGRQRRRLRLPRGAAARAFERARDPLTQTFLLRAALLQALGYLDEEARLTEDGRWAAELRHPRVLVLAEVVRRDGVPAQPPRLAGMAAALGSERPPRAGGERVRLGGLASLVRRLARLEAEFGLEPNPVEEEFRQEWDRRRRRALASPAERRAAAAEAWAGGAEWVPLVQALDVEEGDLQRIILQAAEALLQLEGLPHEHVRQTARAARRALLRPPVI